MQFSTPGKKGKELLLPTAQNYCLEEEGLPGIVCMYFMQRKGTYDFTGQGSLSVRGWSMFVCVFIH